MTRVNHFEIPASDPNRAADFYKKVFGWKIEKWAGPIDYWLVTTGEDKEPGIDGAIMEKTDLVKTTTNTITVPSIDKFVKKITDAGGKVLMPKQAVPGIGYMAYCADPEGNIFGIMQNDPKAK